MTEREKSNTRADEISHEKIKSLVEKCAELEYELEVIDLLVDDILFEQEDDADCMFWLQSGRLEVVANQEDGTHHVLDILTDGSHVGEMGLLSDLQRTATIRALEKSKVLRVTMDDIIKLSSHDEDLLNQLNSVAASRWQELFLDRCLKQLFDDLSDESIREMRHQLEWRDLRNGDVLFHEGDEPDGVYIIVSGRLRAKALTREGFEKTIGELGPSELVGDYALLTDEPRSATVYAVRNTSVARMPIQLLDEHISESPTLMRKIARTVIRRQKKLLQEDIDEDNKHLSLTILKHDSVREVETFIDELALYMRQYGDTMVIDHKGFDEYFGQNGVSQVALDAPISPIIASRLNELESRYRFIFFITDNADSNWTQRAVGQSDRLLIVANSAGSPAISESEKVSEQQTIPLRTDLVLLHPEETVEPTATIEWLERRNVNTHYHVRQGDASHMLRLARRLSGKAIGLVCSGGGARGYAQMGVFKALSEQQIPVDYIAGTSMGSIIAGGIACGYTYEQCAELAEWTAKLGVIDHTFPLASVAASKNVTNVCKRSYGERMIEDLWLPYFCISSNLTKAERVVHQRGKLWRAVRASMAIPGVFLPVVEDGEVLVDGGVMDNYPVRLMSEIGETSRLIGVNVNPYRERTVHFDYDTSLSGWRLLFNRLNPFSKKLKAPSVMGTILRSLDVNSMKTTKSIEPYLELNIVPDLRKYSMHAYGKWQKISDIGYQEAKDTLSEWKRRQADLG